MMQALDRSLAGPFGGDAHQQRLNDFRERHKRMGWLYQLLDVAWGMELAADDVARHERVAAVVASLIVNGALSIVFTLIWVRYDLVSTWNTLNPLAIGLTGTLNAIIPDSWGLEATTSVVGGFLEFFIRMLVTFAPTLIQIGMPYMASRHAAAWLALLGSMVFDMATDSVDVRADVPVMFGWLQTMAADASQTVWVALILLGVFLLFIRSYQWPVWVALIAVAVSCLAFGQASNIIYWANASFWTFFASFAAQSLAFIFVAKTIMLAHRHAALSRGVVAG